MIAGNTDLGALYGTLAFLRLMQTQKPITGLDVSSAPKIKHRHLNYWDTERLYAGNNTAGTGGLNGENGAVFDFAATGASAAKNLPVILNRYIVVARALASLGINGITINNVNANNAYLTTAYIAQEAALADALRPYGVRLALSINYTAPTDTRFAPDTLTNAQLDPARRRRSAAGGRARRSSCRRRSPTSWASPSRPTPRASPARRTSATTTVTAPTASAPRVAPLGMKVFWRTFVYNADVDHDRLKRAYLEFGYIDDEVAARRQQGPRRRQRVPADQERPAGLPGPRAGAPDVRPHGEHQPGAGAADHAGVHGPEQDAHLPRRRCGRRCSRPTPTPPTRPPASGWSATSSTARRRGSRTRAIVGVANLGNADNLTGHHFAPGQPLRLGPAGVGLDARLGGHRARVGADDLEQRRAGRRHDREDDDGLARGAGELSDAARHRRISSAPATTTARCRTSGSSATTGALSTTTRPTAPGSASTAPPPAATSSRSTSRRSQQRFGNIATTPENLLDVVPPRAVGLPDGQWPDRTGTSSSTATRWASST